MLGPAPARQPRAVGRQEREGRRGVRPVLREVEVHAPHHVPGGVLRFQVGLHPAVERAQLRAACGGHGLPQGGEDGRVQVLAPRHGRRAGGERAHLRLGERDAQPLRGSSRAPAARRGLRRRPGPPRARRRGLEAAASPPRPLPGAAGHDPRLGRRRRGSAPRPPRRPGRRRARCEGPAPRRASTRGRGRERSVPAASALDVVIGRGQSQAPEGRRDDFGRWPIAGTPDPEKAGPAPAS